MILKVRGPGKRVEDVAINLFMHVKDLKALVANVFHVEPENQRLIHRGKQLEDEHKLWDYGLEIYDTVLLTVKPKVIQKEVVTKNREPFSIIKHLKTLRQIPQSKHFKVGEFVDFLDTHFGAWFQGKVKIIYVEDQARLDAISEDVDPPTQWNGNGESRGDCGSTVVSDNTKDTPVPSTVHRDSPVVISDDDSVDVVTVRSSSPESVIYIPPEDDPVIYVEGDDELQIYVPPPIYVEPYSEAVTTVETIDSTPELEVLQETIFDQSSKNTSAVSDTNGVKTVDTAGSGQRSNGIKQEVHQEIPRDRSYDAVNAVSVICGRETVGAPGSTPVGAPGSKPVGAPGFTQRPNETQQQALQRALQEALQAMTCQFSDKKNAVSDTDHSESGDSGHSSHMSVKNASQGNGRPGCEDASNQEVVPDDGCLYEIINLNNVDQIEMVCKLSQVRPMSRKRLDLAEMKQGQIVLVNYSAEEPEKIGHWFDFKVSKVVNGSKKKWLEGDVKVLNWNPYQVTNVKITKVDMIWEIEKLTLLKHREDFCSAQNVQKRPVRAICDNCNDNPAAQCRACSCRVCGMKSDPSKQILCDECDSPFHVWCLNPPLAEVPDADQWFCDNCNMTSSAMVRAGATPMIGKKRGRKTKIKTESLEVSSGSPKVKSASPKGKKTPVKRKDTSLKENTPRKEISDSPTETSFSPRVMSVCTVRQSMANAHRTKKCTIVPPNHFGQIPGVEVGTTWRFRIQASEAGVHRPPVGGMHGREDVGAFSIVLSGGYEDDEDFGDWFWYTGAGGRDLSGNRRTTNRQSCDQLFTHTNKALAVNCDCPVSDEGGKAVDWRAGKPVRVLRSYKFRKRSAYAPEEGIRYDGLYKVVEYRPERGRSGFIVWRYLLRRDDPTPAPWTDEGKMLMETLGLQIEYPENYEPPEPKRRSEGSSRIPTENLRIPTENLRIPTENLRIPTENLRIPTENLRIPTENFRIPTENHVTNENEENSFNYRIKLEPIENNTSVEENHATDENEENSLNKRLKSEPYELDPSIEAIIAKDEQNMRFWEFCSFHLRDGQMSFLKAVQDSFTCICCNQLLNQPITTPCGHNICMDCLQRSFEAENYTCPTCRETLPDRFPFVVNEHLSEALKAFFPGYAPQT